MSETWKYGIRHRPVEDEESHLMRWCLLLAAIVASVSFICTRGCRKQPTTPVTVEPPPTHRTKPPASGLATATTTAATTGGGEAGAGLAKPQQLGTANTPTSATATTTMPFTMPAPPRPQPKPLSPAAKLAEKWLSTASTRPPLERTLLERLADAERQGRPALAADTIERLRARPAMADLDDQLARRLGELNFNLLMSGGKNPWTATVEVRRGDKLQRLAREHGTTTAAVLTLNNLKDSNHISVGQKIRLLEFPKATLVVHKGTKIADLTLNGKFFKRYYVLTSAKTAPGPYPITREKGPLDRFNELGIKAAGSDRDELKMFLAPGSSLAIADP